MTEGYVTHGPVRFWLAMFAISLPLLFPFALGAYAAQATSQSIFFWLGLGVSLVFILAARLFEQTIRREGAAKGWDEAYEANAKHLRIGQPYPGWKFPKFP